LRVRPRGCRWIWVGKPLLLDRLADLVRQGRAILDQGEWSEKTEVAWYEINHAFHRSIHHASQNTVLRNAIRMTLIYPVFGDPARLCPSVAAAVPLRLRQVAATTPEHLLSSQGDHERLLDAIRTPGQRRGGSHHDRPCSRYETSSSCDRHPPLIDASLGTSLKRHPRTFAIASIFRHARMKARRGRLSAFRSRFPGSGLFRHGRGIVSYEFRIGPALAAWPNPAG
jgi:hypothetical protein